MRINFLLRTAFWRRKQMSGFKDLFWRKQEITWQRRDTSSFLVWITLGFSLGLPLMLGPGEQEFSLRFILQMASWPIINGEKMPCRSFLWLYNSRHLLERWRIDRKEEERKVLRVLPSSPWVPRNQGWLNFWETKLVTVRKSLHRSCWTELTCQGILLP